MADGRHIPLKALIRKLGLDEYDVDAPWTTVRWDPKRVRLPLRQHVGQPALPVVEVGQRVETGQLVAEIPPNALGARVHASIGGTVRSVSDGIVEIHAQ
jgi:Na+-translocating ferredoxin:NAD+ oxidoreductase RnfC subunit